MDERLIPADPSLVRRVIARACLAEPAIDDQLGEIHLEPHQVEAGSRLLKLLREHDGALLADATGLGKTYVAIAVARVFPPALVVAPAALRGMWHESLGRTGVAAGVITYEALSRGMPVAPHPPALLILDEAHHARNPRSRRYAALANLAWGAKVLLLSATPLHNRGRDLRALVALFAGTRAYAMSDQDLSRCIVRRTSVGYATASPARLPRLASPRWIEIPGNPDTLRAITALRPAVPPADGATAHALTQLGLIRAWSSSESALRATLQRRLRRVAVFTAVLESGRRPDRRELASWPVVDDAIQLGFPDLIAVAGASADVLCLRAMLDAHAEGVRAILRSLERNEGTSDRARTDALREIRAEQNPIPIVAFTQFADTASAMFRGCVHEGGAALVTGTGARIAAGRVTVDEIVRGFDVGERGTASRALPLQMLVATDVLSEGLSLRRAGALVHLDLPWTVARLEQRVGRLRRLGSPHASIALYAIGPPVSARELIHVIRALQRKVRVSSALGGTDELQACVPILGSRMNRAVSSGAGRASHRHGEALRTALARWSGQNDVPIRPVDPFPGQPVAVALVMFDATPRLVAVIGSHCSDDTRDVLSAVQTLSRSVSDDAGCTDLTARVAGAARRWASQQLGRELARLGADPPSPAHAAVLRLLQERLLRASRTERASLGSVVERCRELVNAARGAGAETALAQLIASGEVFDLESLRRLLEARVTPRAHRLSPRIMAIVATGATRSTDAAALSPESGMMNA